MVDLKPFLTKFITVTLDDGTEESGFVANPDAFKNSDNQDGVLVLLNGLLNAEVKVSRIVDVHESVREDTIKIPIIGFDTPLMQEESESINQEIDSKLDELFDMSLEDEPNLDLNDLMNEPH